MKNLLLGLILMSLSSISLLAAEGFAVLPFIGTAHNEGNLHIAAKHVTKELQEIIAKKGLSKNVVVDYDQAKALVNGSNYDANTLAELCNQLNVRYVLFADSKEIYLGERFHRFNVYCKAFDGTTMEFIDLGQGHHTSAHKLIEWSNWPILRPKRWVTLSKLSEPFQVFLKNNL